jgi:DNA-binding NarL/FixJ family response regulator
MVAVAIYSVDPALRLRLEQLLRAELGYTVASVTHDPAAVSRLIEQSRVDTVVAHAPPREQLTDWRDRYPAMTFVVIANESDEEEAFGALYGGASAILPRWAESSVRRYVITIDSCQPRQAARGAVRFEYCVAGQNSVRFSEICTSFQRDILRRHSEIAVGTLITERPPHRTVRAQFGHTAPTLGV